MVTSWWWIRASKPAMVTSSLLLSMVSAQSKRLHNRNGRVALVAENPAYPTIDIRGDMELVIWGVVIGKFKRM